MLLVYTKHMYITILGRQPAIGMAELERVYGAQHVRWFSTNSARIDTDHFTLDHLGGTQKAGKIVAEVRGNSWRDAHKQILQTYTEKWRHSEAKITVGISAYGFDVSARDIQKTGVALKQKLKTTGTSIRIVPNASPDLSTAVSHHNKLGLSNNKNELIIVHARSKIIVAESIGAQNITAYVKRDQQRPKRDAFVGMLPPKLAQIIINLAAPHIQADQPAPRILDPFCGTGVVLQEAALMGYQVYGTDISEKMIRYSRDNLTWLQDSHHVRFDWYLHEDDAMHATWQQPVDAVACESYLGQPFSAPPSPEKLAEVRRNCNHIIGSFLKNIAPQLAAGTPLCIAIPAWRDKNGRFQHLPLIEALDTLGYTRHTFKNITNDQLLYYRESQVVARELLVLTRS